MVTVGVAIPVPQPWGARLDTARAATGDPQAPHVPSHVTLLGPTDIPDTALPDAERHLADVAARSNGFDVHLRGTGTFRPVTEVVFVTLAEGISGCERLEARVRSGPLAKDLTYPYHPHVTVAQAVPTAALDKVYTELADFEARFTVDSFVLYTHHNGVTWHARDRYRLAG